jgi:hypothetical protein
MATRRNLILKRASASRPSGQWKDEDYDVLADSRVVGRILEAGSRFGPPELRWGWSITAIVPASPAMHGIQPRRSKTSHRRKAWREIIPGLQCPRGFT